MSLAADTRLGPCEIQSALGAGWMGEVYWARDPRLGRDVAIKVLPETFAADPSRLRRLEQEARAIAASVPRRSPRRNVRGATANYVRPPVTSPDLARGVVSSTSWFATSMTGTWNSFHA